MQSNLGQPQGKIALADKSQRLTQLTTNLHAHKTVCRVTPRKHYSNTTVYTAITPKRGCPRRCHPAQDNRCADWNYLARTRRCGRTKLWIYKIRSMTQLCVGIGRASASAVPRHQCDCHGNPLDCLVSASSDATGGVRKVDITILQNSSTATRRPFNPPVSHWALKPVSSTPRELPLILVALQLVLDIHRGRRRITDRKESLHFLLVVVVWE